MTEREVELIGVTKTFGGITAVKNVTLSVRKGSFFSLLGPSGCGKTTLLRIIAGLEEPDSGVVKIRGKIVNDVPPNKRGVGLVFQGTALFPHLNVYDNISFGLKIKGYSNGEIEDKVMNILKLMDMPPQVFAKRKIDQLSGGEVQRVEIARSLVLEPAVLFLDEPLGPLDLKIRRRMQLELKSLQNRIGGTFIYVTHDQGEALTMSDEIAVMNKGELKQVGTPREIYDHPEDPFVADFIGETNFLEGMYVGDGIFDVEGLGFIKVPANIEGKGKRFFLSIRKENMILGEELTGVDNVFEGRIQQIIYKGSYVLITTELAENIKLVAQVPPWQKVCFLSPGDKINLGWKIEKGVLIKK